jgi:RimJ/RimL family protein N-acetyltransferase
MTKTNWQPTLIGPSFKLRPLLESDFKELHLAASDPLIWEVHPDRLRHTLERFQIYFDSGIKSQGALAIFDQATGKMVGSSRFSEHSLQTSSVEIGYTFLTRDYWGGKYNRELKTLMLNYAFQFVDTVYFVVGNTNFRSQKAMAKIGGILIQDTTGLHISGDLRTSVVFKIQKSNWLKSGPRL